MPIVIELGSTASPAGPGDQKAEGDKLNRGLPLGQSRNWQRNSKLSQIFAQARDEDFPAKDDDRRPEREARDGLIGGENENHRRDKKLVGDRIQHSSKRGLLRPGARQIAVEKIADSGGDEDGERRPSRPRLLRPEQESSDKRDRRDARVSQYVGQRPVAAELTGGRGNHLRSSRHRGSSPVNSARRRERGEAVGKGCPQTKSAPPASTTSPSLMSIFKVFLAAQDLAPCRMFTSSPIRWCSTS